MNGGSTELTTSILHIQEPTRTRDRVDQWLEHAGYTLYVVRPADAGQFLVGTTPDLVISECAEACQHLKADPATASIPLVQLLSSDGRRAHGDLADADAYLSQPVQSCALLSIVQVLIRARRIESEHARATRKWTQTFNALRDAVLVLDDEQHLVDCNRAMDELFKQDAHDTSDRPHADLLWYKVRRLVASAQAHKRESSPLHQDESEIALLGRAYQVVTEAPEPDDGALTVMTLSDITERKNLERGYRDSAAELLFAARRKEEFLAMLAHELRNPLNAIVAAHRLLDARATSDPESERLRSVVDRQSRHMARLIDDLLDVSRITRGDISLHLEPLDLRDVVERACDSQRAVLEGRRQHLALDLPSHPVSVQGDELRLEQVIANLVANASKYSYSGATIILALHEDRDGNPASANLVLSDHGIGIPSDMLEAVFEMFVQVDRSLDRTLGGLGLGLTIVKQVVERHGGSVRAHSEGLGKGSRFVIQLPLHAAQPEAQPPAEQRDAKPSPLDVLVIEDNDDTRELMCSLLKRHGHRVVSAADGAHGLELAVERHPEVALIDIGLPGMNGYAIARRLRSSELDCAPYLVALTGYGSPADRERSSAAGFDAHMVKPVDTSRLFALLEQVADHRRSPEA